MVRSLKEGEVTQLKQNTDIISLVSNYVSLKKAGKNYTGLCPFHKEKTPSFVVDPLTQLYHCFGCGNGGDVISFVMKIENLSFIEAVELIAKKTGYTLKYTETGSFENKEKRSRLIELGELAKNYYRYVLSQSRTGRRALAYLKSRKLSSASLEKFEIGYSPDSWDSFIKFARSRGYTDAELAETGLCTVPRNEDSNKDKIFDRFRGRIMFPIKDLLGRIIGFGGRIIPQDFIVSDEKKDRQPDSNYSEKAIVKKPQAFTKKSYGIQKAKYINSPETKLYSKSKSLYGIFEGKNSIVEEDMALIVEGYMDVISLFENKIFNVVASLGTALTIEQVKLISRFTKNIILIFDSDKAGLEASAKGMERLKEYNESLDLYNENNISIKVCLLEKGFDPADYVMRYGKEKFIKLVKSSTDIIDFSINNIIKKYNLKNITEKLRATNELLKFISTLSSSIVQEECIKKIAGELNLKESILLEEMLKQRSVNNAVPDNLHKSAGIESKENPYEEFEPENLTPQKKKEIEALQLLVHGFDRKNIIFNMVPELFKFEDTRNLFKKIKEKITLLSGNNQEINFPVIFSSEELKDGRSGNLYNYIYFLKPVFISAEKICQEVETSLKLLFLNEKTELLKNKIAVIENKIRDIESGTLNEDEKEERLRELEEEYIRYCEMHLELENKKNSLSAKI